MSSYGVEAVERALQLLDAFDNGQEAFELRELAARTGFNKPMIMRLAASLERFGYLRRDAQGRYLLGPSLWRLGSRYRRNFSIEGAIKPVLESMVARTEETAAFYVRAGDRRMCLYRQNSLRRARHHVEIGDHFPLDAGAAGHLILAFTGARGSLYEQIRTRGYHFSHGERDPDVSGIAAPVFRDGGEFLGALITSGLRTRIEPLLDKLLPITIDAARTASRSLGYMPAKEDAYA
ncbi:IclR family transcriptional regulator [Chelativorans sp. Marseille-P2723]|uniref:IclR family transcriptional regulator n=1 Tax=Chelativorans sp. Marseille-P2723 TaxID=2709133 RepID=UPI00156F9F21|nr:IclR family transcriptional regulator [Chelativorans sp. Marseille-P2723]